MHVCVTGYIIHVMLCIWVNWEYCRGGSFINNDVINQKMASLVPPYLGVEFGGPQYWVLALVMVVNIFCLPQCKRRRVTWIIAHTSFLPYLMMETFKPYKSGILLLYLILAAPHHLLKAKIIHNLLWGLIRFTLSLTTTMLANQQSLKMD